jgi:hypothetical protein
MRDEEIAQILAESSEEFRHLSQEHRSLDEALAELRKKRYLSPEEEVEKKRIQKLKLLKKDQMAELIRRYRREHNLA